MIKKMFEKPYFALSIVFIFSVLGAVSFRYMQRNLFPDANRPQIAVVTIEPGASAEDIANHISRRIEEEVHTIDLVRKVSSTSKDEVSVVLTEFEYKKGLDAAAVDITNALSKIITTLPDDILAPQVYKISDATQPVMILAVKPKDGHPLSLAQVRQIADNEMKDDLLNIPGVADVDVFGGYQREIRIDIDPSALDRYGLSVSDVTTAVSLKNKNIPAGLIIDKKNHILLKSADELKRLNEFMNIQVTANVKLKDVSHVHYGYKDRLSAYHGNGSPAIGLGIMRAVGANTMATIKAVNAKLPLLKSKYGNLDIQTADTQEKLINLSIDNMLGALRDAIIMTLIVIFLFLANVRSIFITTVSIIFTYLMTIAFMHIVHLEFNIVTMTAIILAVGLLLDDAIVVMENIERHYYELKKSIHRAALDGTTEIMLADFAGTFTTVIVLVPILFIGGYVQRILREFCSVLILALISSYIVSITIIPLLSPLVMKKDPHKNRLESLIYNFNVYFVNPLVNFYTFLVRIVVEKKKAFILFLIPLMLTMMVTRKAVIPLLGRDLMPPMDTGIVKVSFSNDGNTSIEESDRILSRMEKIVKAFSGVQMLSSTLGSEPGTFSFGSGKQPQDGSMTIHFIDRFHRKKSIWQIEDELRSKFHTIPGIHYVNVYDYGATPLSSIASTVDLMITGDNLKKLDGIGDQIAQRLNHVKGVTSVSRSWYMDKRELAFTIDQLQASRYELKPADISRQVGAALRGRISSIFNIPNENGLNVRVQFKKGYRNSMEDFETMLIKTPFGPVPFRVFARVKPVFSPGVITRQNLNYSLDVYGYRGTAAITHIHKGIDKGVIPKVHIPSGYHLSKEGEIAQMKLSSKRLEHAMILALVLLYFSLVVTFSSWKNPFTIMLAIPLAAVGSMWFMLGFGRHQCMPSMMGLILLAGVIVNNSILLIDFIEEGRKKGMDMHDAILEAIRLRARPILMTAFGTSVGMLPVAFQRAIGLERLSPLAVVAIGGLIIGTFLTLIYVPIFYILFERLRVKLTNVAQGLKRWSLTAFFSLILICFLAGAGRAQVFDLTKVKSYAHDNSPILKAKESEIGIQKGEQTITKSFMLPTLLLNGSYTHYKLEHGTIEGVSGEKQKSDEERLAGNVGFNFVAFAFGKNYFNYRGASLLVKSKEKEYQRTWQNLIFDLSKVYYSLLTVDKTILATQKTIESLKALESEIKQKVKVERLPEVDLLKVEVSLSKSVDDLSGLKILKEDLTGELRRLMGYTKKEKLEIKDVSISKVETKHFDTDKLLSAAYTFRDDLKSIDHAIKSVKYQIKSVKASYFPEVDLRGNYSQQAPGNDDFVSDGSAGVVLSMPLFDGLSRKGKTDKLFSEKRRLQHLFQDKRLEIDKDVKTALKGYRETLVRIDSTKRSVSHAKEVLKIEKLKYKLGRSTINFVLEAEGELLTVRSLFYKASYDNFIALENIRLAAGTLK